MKPAYSVPQKCACPAEGTPISSTQDVPGTRGYAEKAATFRSATLALDFDVLHAAFLSYFPAPPARVLDVGAGIGRDAAELEQRGFTVDAVEPLPLFLHEARKLYPDRHINWHTDSLPELSSLAASATYAMILLSGVWHHVPPDRREPALARLGELLLPAGVICMTLRNGPAGAGTFCFPTHANETMTQAAQFGLQPSLHMADQPSLLPGKEHVRWEKLVLKKSV
ncbi:MAG: class I SAM-dependent methyltransferase [Pseudomonadota bacterium]